MSKAILLSIRPEHALNILEGKKTLELRKRVPKDFKGWVYLYVTKAKPYLLWEEDYIGGHYVSHRWTFLHGYSKEEAYEIWGSAYENEDTYIGIVNGFVIARFWFEEYDKYTDVSDCGMTSCGMECENDFTYKLYDLDDELEKLCLTYNEVYLYGQGKDLYAWHIKKLEIFDEPMDLNEFKTIYKTKISSYENGIKSTEKYGVKFSVTKAPQNYMYVEVEE